MTDHNFLAPDFIGAGGPVNGLGERCDEGSYVEIVVVEKRGTRHRWAISRGAADVLRAELDGVLSARAKLIPHEGKVNEQDVKA